VDIPVSSLNLTLVEAATRQIEAAIDAMQRGDYDIALTLAGAAEGMIKRDGPHMFAGLRDAPKARARFTKEQWIALLNLERDWLKHGGSEMMEIHCHAAAFMVARAAEKLEKWTPKIEDFRVWLLKNLEII